MHTLTLKHIYTDTTHTYTHTHSIHTHTHIYKYKCVLFIFIGIHGYRGAHVEVKGSFERHFSFSTLCCLLFLVDCILAGLLASKRLQSTSHCIVGVLGLQVQAVAFGLLCVGFRDGAQVLKLAAY